VRRRWGFWGNAIFSVSDRGDTPDIQRTRATARILLICPDCAHENTEYAQTLQGKATFYCAGDACDYIFDLGRRPDFSSGFAELCKRFYAALYLVGRPG
jgi:hypothetical protein